MSNLNLWKRFLFLFTPLKCLFKGHSWFYEPMKGDIPGLDGKFRFGYCANCGKEDPKTYMYME